MKNNMHTKGLSTPMIVIGIVVIIAGVMAISRKEDKELVGSVSAPIVAPTSTSAPTSTPVANSTVVENPKDEETVMEQKNIINNSSSANAVLGATYEAYAPEKIALSSADKPVILFFHASWCPSCRSLNDDITANIGSVTQGLQILKIDYDTNVELRKKYKITTQHTLVQVDAKGTLVKKWLGVPSLSDLLSKVSR